MDIQKPALATGEGLSRLKWEYNQEKLAYSDLLCFGTADMDYRSPEPILDALRAVLDRGHLGYPMVPDAYYEAIHGWLMQTASWDVDARVCVAQNAGVYMAAWSALQILTRPGDRVTVMTPVHFCFQEILRLNGRMVLESPLLLKNGGYEIDFASLEACLASGSRVLWLCNPHNPVGRAWTREELERVAALCLKYRVWILSDDVYCGLMFPGRRYVPVASLSKEISYRTVTLYSVSKTFNTAGLRHAFIVAENPEFFKQYTELLTSMNLHYGQNLMGIVATTAALTACGDWVRSVMEGVAQSHRMMAERFATHTPSCRVLPAEAGYFAWIDLRALKVRPQMLSYLLEQEEHIIVENGYPLGKGGAGFIRFNLATSQENVLEGTDRLLRFCARHLRSA